MSNSGDVVNLDDGCAMNMGDGVFVVVQESEAGPMDVVLTRADLERMLAADDTPWAQDTLRARVSVEAGRQVHMA